MKNALSCPYKIKMLKLLMQVNAQHATVHRLLSIQVAIRESGQKQFPQKDNDGVERLRPAQRETRFLHAHWNCSRQIFAPSALLPLRPPSFSAWLMQTTHSCFLGSFFWQVLMQQLGSNMKQTALSVRSLECCRCSRSSI